MSTSSTSADRTGRQRRLEHFKTLIGVSLGDRCELKRLIGVGGMGAVFEAQQKTLSFERTVAVKLIPAHDPNETARFEREARTISRLRHPNTVTVHDFGRTDTGYLYMVMELLDGRTLHDVLKQEGVLHPIRVLRIAIQVLRSLGEAHRQGIVHRDIKPNNVFLTSVHGEPDFVKVLDFGIAKVLESANPHDKDELTQHGHTVGTPRYMSPEHLLGDAVDARSDLYSLGVMIYRCITGRHPFEGRSGADVAALQAKGLPPLPESTSLGIPLTEDLRETVYRVLAQRPSDRFQTADEFRTALLNCLAAYASSTVSDGMDLAAPAPRKRGGTEVSGAVTVGRKPGDAVRIWTIAALAVAVIGVGLAVAAWILTRTPVVEPAAPAAEGPPPAATPADLPVVAALAVPGPEIAPPPVPGPVPAPVKTLRLQVASDAPGLKVTDLEGRLVGVTPFEIALPASRFPMRVRYERPGRRYLPDVIVVDPATPVNIWFAQPVLDKEAATADSAGETGKAKKDKDRDGKKDRKSSVDLLDDGDEQPKVDLLDSDTPKKHKPKVDLLE